VTEGSLRGAAEGIGGLPEGEAGWPEGFVASG